MAKKIELLHTTYDESGNIESQEVVHPLTSPDCIIMENGKTLDEVMGDGIATPTLTHEGTSFKVGVGDSNIEVVDGDVAGMTLKGQSYQNILPKPTTLIMETDEKEFKINDKIDSNIIIDDNIAEIATVKGKTIVNTVQEESGSEYTVLGEDLSGQSIIHVKEAPTLEGSTLVNLILGKSVENSHYTDYTIAKIDKTKTYLIKFNSTKNIVQVGFIVNDTTWNVSKGSGLDILDGYVILKPNENLDITKLRVVTNNSTGSYVLKTMLFEYQEGMENWDIPYFEGEKYFESNIKGVTLQGQTLVNTIQEPCKDDYVVLGAEDGIEISAETGGHGTIENTVQGGINGATLKGQTLVNLIDTENGYGMRFTHDNTDGDCYTVTTMSHGQKVVVNQAPSSWRYFAQEIKLQMLKPRTKYFVSGEFQGISAFQFLEANGIKPISTSGDVINNRYAIIETGGDLYGNITSQCLYAHISSNIDSGSVLMCNDVILVEYQEGMENWNIPYFEGMKSVQMPVLTTTGKNLFDGKLEYGLLNNNNGQLLNSNDFVRSQNFIPINCEKITFTVINGECGLSFYFYDENKNYISNKVKTKVSDDFSIPAGVAYLKFRTYPISDESITNNLNTQIQLEEGKVATSYEPYQSSTLTTGKLPLTSDMIEQGSFFDSFELNTQTYKYIKVPSTNTDFYTNRIRSKATFKVHGGDKYIFNLNTDYAITLGFCKNGLYSAKNGSWITNGTTITIPSDCDEMFFAIKKTSDANIVPSEFSSVGLEIKHLVNLRKVGDVQDELDLQTGKLTQRIGEVVLDGNKGWSSNALLNNGIMVYMCQSYTNGKIVTDNVVSSTLPFYNLDYLKGLATLDGLTDAFITTITSTGKINLAFKKPFSDLNQLKQYLSQNPITVQYELATPIVKTIDLQVTDQDGNTIPHIQTQPTVTHITASSDYLIPTVTINGNLVYETIIKPSTLYTVRFKHDTVNTDNPLTVDLGGTTQTVTSTEFTITTPSELTHNQLVFSGKNNVVSEVQVIEGNVVGTQYPFFEGMNDVQITDMTRNVNLFDINDTVPGYLGATGKEIKVPDHGNLTSNYIKVKPDTTYVYNHGGFTADFVDYWTGMYFYQDDRGTESNLYTNGTFNRFVYTGKEKKYSNFTFTTPADCEYIRIGSRGLSYDGAWATLYQLDNFDDSKFIARGKNLFNINGKQHPNGTAFSYTITNNKIIVSGNGVNGSAHKWNNIGISVDNLIKGNKYTFTANVSTDIENGYSLIGLYNKNIGGFLDSFSTSSITYTFTAQDTGIIVRFFATNESDKIFNQTTTYYNIQIEEGSVATPYEPYYETIVQQDVDSIPLTSDMFEQGKRERGLGMSMQQCPLTSNSARISSKTLIPVKPNTKYVVQGITSANHIWGDMYDKDGLLCYDNVYGLVNAVIPHDVHYLLVQVKNADESAITPSDLDSMNLILQEVPQEIVLRGIGDIKDELDLTRGEYIQRIGEMVLDGSENWAKSQLASGKYAFTTPHNNTVMSSSYCLCADYITYINNAANIPIYFYIGGSYFNFLTDGDITLQTFKERLNKKPLKIQCILPNPIIHKVNLTNTKVIQSYATETHYETITPSDSLIPNITIPSTLNYDVAIKPSTEYTIRANTSDNLTVDLGGTTGTLLNGKVTLTTPATLTHNEVKFSGTGKVKELMVVEGNEIKDNVPFFNGMKDVEMGGIKLVNIARYKSHANGVSVNTNKTTITFDDDGGVGTTSWGVCQFYDELLKPNTMYTIFMNVTKNTSTNEVPVKIQLGNASERFTNINRGFTGNFVEKIVTSSDISERTLALFFRRGQAGEKVVIQNLMIIEGDWTHLDEIPFIESEMIIEQPIIRSQGKNLFDISRGINYTWHAEYTINGDGSVSVMPTLIDGVSYVQSEFFFLEVGKTYTVSWNTSGNVHANFVWLAGTTNSPYGASNTFTVVEGKNKLTLAMYVDTSSLENVATFKPQIEEGSTATTYEPFKQHTLSSNRVIGYEDGCYYTWDTGTKASAESIASVMSDVEGLNVAYVTHASSNFSFYDKDGVYLSGSMFLSTATDFDRFGFIKIPANAKYMKMACGNKNSAPAKDYHLKATVTGELPLRSLPSGVCDTLNLVTGEYVQRVREIVLDGSQKDEYWLYNEMNQTFRIQAFDAVQMQDSLSDPLRYEILVSSDKLTSKTYVEDWNSDTFISLALGKRIVLRIEGITTTSQLITYLKQNPITVQYKLATPIVRKLGFTTKGNYREITLNGSENWERHGNYGTATRFNVTIPNMVAAEHYHVFSDTFPKGAIGTNDLECINNHGLVNQFQLQIKTSLLTSDSVDGLKQWLSLNPFKIGYLTTNSASLYSNIQKPIFFNNVNVQFMNNNIDIQPSLILQARSTNSYVMDMMKANTLYTMKCLSYSDSARLWLSNGTANTSVATNKSFSFAQSSLDDANKQLVIVGQWYEPMIIEGDVTGKNLPYFKGILSSYHDVDEIELYSVNKNLFDMSKVKPYDETGAHWWDTIIKENEVVSVRNGNIEAGQFGAYATLDVRPNSVYTLYIEMEKDGEPFNGQIYGYENDKVWGNGTFTGYANTPYHLRTSHNAKYITIGLNYGKDFPIGTTFVSKNMRLYLGEESPVYIPHAQNTTLIEMPTRLETVKVVRPELTEGALEITNGAECASTTEWRSNFIPVQPNEFIKVRNGSTERLAHIDFYDVNKNFIGYSGVVNATYVPDNCYFIRFFMSKANSSDLTITRQALKPIQLNSLPNGVRDEIIMKPNSNKAQLIQRVGKVVLDGSEDISTDNSVMDSDYALNEISTYFRVNPTPFTLQKAPASYSSQPNMLCDSLVVTSRQESQQTISNSICVYNDGFGMRPKNDVNNALSLRTHLQQNPITVYYELTTPIIHEIQLKGYPHVYENGTVTLNTDTPHKALVSYNVNQEQLINTQNEIIIRHDQQIDDLYYYIEMYLEEIYQMELFRMKLELSL